MGTYQGTCRGSFENRIGLEYAVMIVTLEIDSDNIIGVKETLAIYLERYGDVRVVSVLPEKSCERKQNDGGKK